MHPDFLPWLQALSGDAHLFGERKSRYVRHAHSQCSKKGGRNFFRALPQKTTIKRLISKLPLSRSKEG